MDKQTTYTFTAYNASVHFCAADAEITINDHAGGEIVVIDGLNKCDLHESMINYVRDVSSRKDKEKYLDFLRRMQDQLTKTLEVYRAF